MKRFIAVNMTLVFVGLNSAAADPPTCLNADTTFNVSNGSWFKQSSWDVRVPLSTDIVCIPDSKVANIAYGLCSGGTNDGNPCDDGDDCTGGSCVQQFAVAGAIVVDSGGRVEGTDGCTLRLYGEDGVPNVIDSTVDGSLEMRDCSLELANDVTIHGNGGAMKGEYDGTTTPTVVTAASGASDPVLTLQGANNASVSTSLKVYEIWTFEIDVVNNAYVICDIGLGLGGGTDRTLLSDGYDFSGSGIWMGARRTGSDAHGRIEIRGNMTGSATLRSEGTGELDIHSSASFSSFSGDVEVAGGTFRNYLSSFYTSGDFTISSGEFENKVTFSTSMDLAMTGGVLSVEESFTTSGDLDMNAGSIVVYAGKVADFSN